MSKKPRLWITYARKDDTWGDFSHLAKELESVGLEVKYDRNTLAPGQRLWPQIESQITSPSTDGWAFLVTPQSLSSQACQEELAYALDRALKTKGEEFPMIGLLHGVKPEDLPAPLRVRLCVNLADPEWQESVLAGLEKRPPRLMSKAESVFVWQLHTRLANGVPHIVIEVRPRFETVMYWRFAAPKGCVIAGTGYGPAGKPAWGTAAFARLNGTVTIEREEAQFVGQGDAISPSISAYLSIKEKPPEWVAFGVADNPVGIPAKWEIVRLRSN